MRQVLTVALAALLAGLTVAGDVKEKTILFSKENAGKVPPGWTVAKTGKGDGSAWKVVADATAPSKTGYALAQVAQSPNAVFNLCVADDTSYAKVEAAVAFKAIRGENDQGGGLVWRYRDNDNYYVARMNPLENNYRVYKVVAGKRIQLGTKEDLKAKAGAWHKLKINMAGDHIECFLDGEKLLDVQDATFKDAGKVGLWTKADAQTHFDEFRVGGGK